MNELASADIRPMSLASQMALPLAYSAVLMTSYFIRVSAASKTTKSGPNGDGNTTGRYVWHRMSSYSEEGLSLRILGLSNSEPGIWMR
jgi:hypothetical protein